MYLELDGVVYGPVDVDRALTAEYDIYMMQALTDSGLLDAINKVGQENPDDLLKAALVSLTAPGAAARFAAGLITPADTAWSLKVAEATAAHIEHLPKQADRAAVIQLVAAGLARFFQHGRPFLLTSR